MHSLCALFTLFLQPLLTAPTTVLPPSGGRNGSFVSLQETTNVSSDLTGLTSLSSPISLTFDLFGTQIPSSAVNAAFRGAITEIYPSLRDRPDAPITNDNFQYRAVGTTVQLGVTAVRHHGVSWMQLDAVLRQTSRFMNGDVGVGRQHMQELSFEIIIDRTTVGEGLVTYRPFRGLRSGDPTLLASTTAKNTKRPLAPTETALRAPTANGIHFRIPETPFTLVFGFLGDAIPTSDVWAAFEGAHSQILGPLTQHPASPIPGDRFEYTTHGVRITVLEREGAVMTWMRLSWVLGGIYGFMTGPPERYQLLTCEILFRGRGSVGYASVWYYPPGLEVAKRARRNATISSPAVPNYNNHLSLRNIQAIRTIHCHPLPSRLSLYACFGAIFRFPSSPAVGRFHSGGADDGFRLPVSRTYEECSVLVKMRDDGADRDKASWSDVAQAAGEMNGFCERSVGSYRRYGSAWMYIGELDRIYIELHPAGEVRKGDKNGTIADESW